MTAAGHMSRTIRDDLHGVSAPIPPAKYPQLAYTSRLRISPDNTPRRKVGLGHTLKGDLPRGEASFLAFAVSIRP